MVCELSQAFAQTAIAVKPAGAEPVAAAIWLVIEDGVVFVITHYRKRIAGVDHSADEVKNQPDLGTAINVVAKEDDLAAFGVAVTSAMGRIAEVVKQKGELVVVTVYVADEIKVE